MVTDKAQANGDDVLVYKGRTWRVESEPVVVESEEGSDLVEVWVKRGEGIGESS
jgi:hypothetical protein